MTGAGVSLSNAVTLNPNGGTIDTQANTATLSGPITGSGGLSVTSSTTAGTLVLSSGSNSYTGGTNIQFGTLQLGTGGVLPTGTAVVLGLSNGGSSFIGTNGTLDLNGNSVTLSSLTTSSAGPGNTVTSTSTTSTATLTFAGALNSTTVFNGLITQSISAGAGLALMVTSGTLVLGDGADNWNGGTTISGTPRCNWRRSPSYRRPAL